ncbi:hypothetical protein L3Q82_005088 [Scortum barcoo]|uniref:Uncharacterized protein n=1 Tax=Scortum barcoo TaxID=214431 RepID=A0ACB8VF55_9TELE|nr:hypothetical protein L3Q82_005088 [Scortum barcoo]
MRPYYLPREFMSTVVIAVYIPPSADAAVACEVISSTTAKLQTDHPDAFMVITGDFNHGSLDKTLNNFHQYVDCPTRDNKTLDLLYANAMDAYDATAPPPRQVRPELSHDDYQVCPSCEKAAHAHQDAQTVHCFSNNKPWITRDLKALLNKKKMAFRAGDREEQRRVQHELRDMLRTCKDNYRRKLEAKLQQNNHLSICPPPLPTPSPSSNIRINPCPTVTTGQVKRQLGRLHQRKAAGPDGITPRILKTCASQLSPVLGHLYNLSLSQEKVPMLWKTSCLVPVPKKSRPSDPADYRPVALTSHVMKVLERLVLAQLRPQNHLRLNVNKTREMVIDFRRKKMPSQPLWIRGEVVEEVEDYKYLGVVIDNRLDWKSNTEAVYKKGMSRLSFLRKLRSFNVGSRMLEIFYQSVVASAIFFAACVLGQQHQSQRHQQT